MPEEPHEERRDWPYAALDELCAQVELS
ncbi:MAG: hypothetical protein JWO48_2705, partial [Bryobacterales bacterium]|nr:hypothetical protein [Bryobacterales bacterium]